MNENLYVHRLLALYTALPDTPTRPRRLDRVLAKNLYRSGLPLPTAVGALLLAALRRASRPPDAMPLPPIRSLAYFLPLHRELDGVPEDYLRHLFHRAMTFPEDRPIISRANARILALSHER